jgi:hypothetical protein
MILPQLVIPLAHRCCPYLDPLIESSRPLGAPCGLTSVVVLVAADVFDAKLPLCPGGGNLRNCTCPSSLVKII